MTRMGDKEWSSLNYFQRDCPISLTVKEGDVTKPPYFLCSAGRRERELFKSSSHVIRMHLNIDMNKLKQLPHFVLKYQGKNLSIQLFV